jgi:hypothetical protein
MHVLLLTQERIHVRPKTQDIKGEKKQEGPADQGLLQVRAEARWMDTAERQDGHLNQVGKVVSLADRPQGQDRKSRTQTQTNIFYFYLMNCLFVWSVASGLTRLVPSARAVVLLVILIPVSLNS